MNQIRDILETMEYGPAPEDAAIARAWLAKRAEGFGLFIDGAFEAPGATFGTSNPADGAPLARVTQGTPEDVARAVAAARRAQPGWAATPGHERAKHLYALARHVQQHARFSPCWRRSTTASRSARAATSTSRS
jgi:aldehyde dehydrogenase (NAD+)